MSEIKQFKTKDQITIDGVCALLDSLKEEIRNGSIVAVAAVGVEEGGGTRAWWMAGNQTPLAMLGAVAGLQHYMYDEIT